MEEIVSIEGPIEYVSGKMMIRIPLEHGGSVLAPLAKGIGVTDDEYLNVEIQPWFAERLNISLGSLVIVDNKNGKFTITRSETNDLSIEIELEGRKINGLADFYSEVEKKLTKNLEWGIGRNLDAFRDILRGGFGIHECDDRLRLTWKDYEHAEKSLSWDETIKYISGKLEACHPSNAESVRRDLEKAQNHEGQTLAEILVEIMVEAGNVELRLVRNA